MVVFWIVDKGQNTANYLYFITTEGLLPTNQVLLDCYRPGVLFQCIYDQLLRCLWMYGPRWEWNNSRVGDELVRIKPTYIQLPPNELVSNSLFQSILVIHHSDSCLQHASHPGHCRMAGGKGWAQICATNTHRFPSKHLHAAWFRWASHEEFDSQYPHDAFMRTDKKMQFPQWNCRTYWPTYQWIALGYRCVYLCISVFALCVILRNLFPSSFRVLWHFQFLVVATLWW